MLNIFLFVNFYPITILLLNIFMIPKNTPKLIAKCKYMRAKKEINEKRMPCLRIKYKKKFNFAVNIIIKNNKGMINNLIEMKAKSIVISPKK